MIFVKCEATEERRKHTHKEKMRCLASYCVTSGEDCQTPNVGHSFRTGKMCEECAEYCLYFDECRWCYHKTELAQYKEDDGEDEGLPAPTLRECLQGKPKPKLVMQPC